MERRECEGLLLEKLKEIADIYIKYNPNGQYLNCHMNCDVLSINNSYYDKDANKPINCFFILHRKD